MFWGKKKTQEPKPKLPMFEEGFKFYIAGIHVATAGEDIYSGCQIVEICNLLDFEERIDWDQQIPTANLIYQSYRRYW